jgi:hypothetical protein
MAVSGSMRSLAWPVAAGSIDQMPSLSDATKLFSPERMIRAVGRRAIWKMLVAVALLFLFRDHAEVTIVAIGVLLALIISDFVIYSKSSSMHEQYLRKYGSTYEKVLAECLSRSNLDELTFRRWLDLKIALERHFGTAEL